MKKYLLVINIILILTVPVFTESKDNKDNKDNIDNKDKEESIYKKYLDILNYGIEEEVVNATKDLGYSPKKEFYTILFQRYKEALLDNTKIGLATYFSDCIDLPKEIIDYLFEEAKNEPSNVKLHTTLLTFLGKKGGFREGELLLEKIDNENNLIQITAVDSLRNINAKELIKPILDRLQLSDTNEDKYLPPEIKSKLILCLGKLKATESTDYLKKIISDPSNDKFIIMYGMVSLAQIGAEDSIDLIDKNLNSEDVKIQEYAGYSLSQFKSPKVLPILRKMLKHNREKIRYYACQGIVLNKDLESINILLYKFTNDPSIMVRNEAINSLLYLGTNGIDALQKYMKNKTYDSSKLYSISAAVTKNPDNFNVQFLCSLYEKVEKKDKDIIAKNVVNGKSNLLDPIIKLLLSSDDNITRIGGIKAVYYIQNSSLWNIVNNIAENDKSPEVKKTAKRFLDLKK